MRPAARQDSVPVIPPGVPVIPPGLARQFAPESKKGASILRFVVAITAALVWAVALAQSAAAVAPIREDLPPFSGTTVLTGICAFPVTVEAMLTGSQTLYFDQDGTLTRVVIDTTEQDTFTANEKTLVGLPYTFKVTLLFDPETGEITHAYNRGIFSRVRLPDGDLFLTAGRTDFILHPDEPFVLQPDVGAQGNIEGFCAALSP
jgi:hypothetical protein